MGSGAEISLATLRSAVAATPGLGQDLNQDVWDRWNALTPQNQAAGFLAADKELITAMEALTESSRWRHSGKGAALLDRYTQTGPAPAQPSSRFRSACDTTDAALCTGDHDKSELAKRV